MLAVLALAPAYVLPARPATGAPTVRMVDSWYDSGKRLDAAAPAAGGGVTRQILSKKGEVTTVVEGAKKSLPLGVKDESQVNPLTGKVLGVALALAVGTPFISAALNGTCDAIGSSLSACLFLPPPATALPPRGPAERVRRHTRAR